MRICDAVGVVEQQSVDNERTVRENSMLVGGFCADCDDEYRDDSPLVAGGRVDRRLMTLLMLLLCLLLLSFCSLFVLDFLMMAHRTVCKISP